MPRKFFNTFYTTLQDHSIQSNNQIDFQLVLEDHFFKKYQNFKIEEWKDETLITENNHVSKSISLIWTHE